jgi:hypothetical protein
MRALKVAGGAEEQDQRQQLNKKQTGDRRKIDESPIHQECEHWEKTEQQISEQIGYTK